MYYHLHLGNMEEEKEEVDLDTRMVFQEPVEQDVRDRGMHSRLTSNSKQLEKKSQRSLLYIVWSSPHHTM